MKLLKPLSFLPALCMMGLIIWFSSQSAADSSEVSISFTQTVLEIIRDLFRLDWPSEKLIQHALLLEHFMRKLAHFTEYFLLAVFCSIPLYVYHIRSRSQILPITLFCAVFAGFDELHQCFVPGRAGAFSDVCLDTFGSFCGSLLIYFTVMIRHS